MQAPRAIAIMGPTASGKSEVAERLAEIIGTRIVNADAFQVYRGFDIGTAKPRNREPYDLIDILEPEEGYSVGRYVRDARPLLETYTQAGADTVVCGGSGLYVRALFEGYRDMQPADLDLRRSLVEDMENLGIEALLARERVSADELSHDLRQNRRRLLRFLEKRRMPSEPHEGISWRSERLKFAIDLGRDDRNDRIEARVRRMVDDGWREEVQGLLNRGVSMDAPAFRAIGYVDMAEVVIGRFSLDQAIDRIVVATRQYAKRQVTWLRKEPHLQWVDGSGGSASVVDRILNILKGGSNG